MKSFHVVDVLKITNPWIISAKIHIQRWRKTSTCEICLPSDGFDERLLHVNRFEFFYEYVTYVYSLNII
jgi:hypothetical protein